MTTEQIQYLIDDVRFAWKQAPIDPRRCREALARVEELLRQALKAARREPVAAGRGGGQ